MQLAELGAEAFGEHVGAHRRPLAPLDERGARRSERARHQPEPHVTPEGPKQRGERRGEQHGQEEEHQRERAHEEGNRARRRLVDERRLLARAQHGAQRRRKATCNALGDDGAGAAGEHDAADLAR